VNQLNTSLRTVFQDLVERRLWPVALALVVALIAIPVLLSNSSSETASTTTPVPPVTPATGAAGSLTAFQPVVNSEGSKSSEIEKNLSGFDSKDPFKVQGLPTSSGQTADAGAAAGGTTTTGTDTTGTGSGTAGTGSQGTSGSGDSTGQTVKFYDWTVTVRFGIGDNLDKKRMMRFRALPNSENPVVVFMDVTTNGESAVFMVSTATGTTGDGDCEPDDTCTFVYMKPGQTQKFEAVDADDKVVTYTLKLTDIKLEEIEPPADAASKSGRASTRAERLARRAARIERDRRDAGFAARLEAVGF
jgi:hypothetical protein